MRTKKMIRNYRFKYWTLLLVLFIQGIPNSSFGQVLNCPFDRLLGQMLNENPEFLEQMDINESMIQGVLNDPNMLPLINSNEVYTVPVVVHIMHLGEAQGNGSNISDAQIIQAIDDLNAHFAPTDIQYCLAERDPQGSAHSGINRVDASGICDGLCFTSGMQISGPLANTVKAASLWPNTDYLNIWVVHSITGAIGYATFPGAAANVDGVVMDDDFFGIGGSSVLAHEAGHFLNLYHTFQGDCPSGVNCSANCNATICPPSDPTLGDRVADTPPHKRSCFDCDFSGTNACDGGSPNSLFGPNYMNYADISCLEQFTDGQVDRMRCALVMLRPDLLNSLGCVPGCTSAMAGFTPSVLGGEQGIEITFSNTSTGATDYSWEVEDQTFTTTDLTYTFNNQGTFDVCLTASNATCTNRTCQLIEINGPNPCYEGLEVCNEVLNGNLEQNNYGLDGVCHFSENPGDCDMEGVCNWRRKRYTPAFCSETNGANTFIMADWREAIVTLNPLDLEDGQTCVLSFEYYHVGEAPTINNDPEFSFGLIETPDWIGNNANFTESIRELGIISDPDNDIQGGYLSCPPLDQTFHYVETTFTYNAGDPLHLYFTLEATINVSNFTNSFMHVRDIQVNCCGPQCQAEPAIQLEQDACTFNFSAFNTGDPGDCYWDFGNGDTSEDCDVTYNYTVAGNYTVCLTIACDDLSSTTVCEEVVVPENCGVTCDAPLVQFGYGDDCDDDDDDFDPFNISPCIASVSDLEPYNGNSGASCLGETICIASTVNGWEFTMTTEESIEVNHLIASLLYPLNDETAGGTVNNSDCPSTFDYVFAFFLNGDMDPIHTINGTIEGSTTTTFTEEIISLPSTLFLEPGDELRVRIDGLTTDPDCDLFELNGLSVNGCCRPCPVDLVDLGPDQTICAKEEITLNATINTHGTLSRRIEERRDDAEEDTTDGDMSLYSSDLEMVQEDEIQAVGVRFNQIDIPQGAVITSAYLQFTADEEDEEATNLTIHGEASTDALEFSKEDFNITSRLNTAASVNWAPGPWLEGDAGANQRTPDLTSIVQEIVDQSGWDYGNSLAFIITGTGKRVAESTSGSSEDAPELVIEYELDASSPYTYLWSTGATTESIMVTPTTTSTYSVTVSDADGCTSTDEVTITVEDCCKGLDVQVDCDGDKMDLRVYLNGDFLDHALYQIEWTIGGVTYPNSGNPLSLNNQEGSHYSLNISQEDVRICNADGIISCKGKGKERSSSTDALSHSFAVFPNPSTLGDQLYLSCTDQRFLNQNVSIRIMNEIGLQINQQEMKLTERTTLPKLNPGVYLLHIFNKNTGEIETMTFRVEQM